MEELGKGKARRDLTFDTSLPSQSSSLSSSSGGGGWRRRLLTLASLCEGFFFNFLRLAAETSNREREEASVVRHRLSELANRRVTESVSQSVSGG